MINAAGLIFSNIHDSAIPELTNRRTMASVPFGCRYRLIDFPLSSMVNAGITRVGIITHNNYQSLVDHIGTGKDWDLARRAGGVKILSPFISSHENAVAGKLYNTRLEALIGASGFISGSGEDFFVISDCDGISNVDISDVLLHHTRTGSDLTLVTRNINPGKCEGLYSVTSGDDGRITDACLCVGGEGSVQVSTNIIVINKTFLCTVINEAVAHGYTDFYRDVIQRMSQKAKLTAYKYDGIYILITSLESYFSSSMLLLEAGIREGLFGEKNRPVYTKLKNTSPTIYKNGSSVKNCCIADGCVIEGSVENCIVFRGVKISAGAKVKDSILFQDSRIGNGASLNCVITDKKVIINDGRTLSGHSTRPFYIGKGVMV